MRYPQVYEMNDQDGQWWALLYGGITPTHQVVPLGGVHIYRDENGEWPEGLVLTGMGAAAEVPYPDVVVVLDALETGA